MIDHLETKQKQIQSFVFVFALFLGGSIEQNPSLVNRRFELKNEHIQLRASASAKLCFAIRFARRCAKQSIAYLKFGRMIAFFNHRKFYKNKFLNYMKKKWNVRSTICMAQRNSYELSLLVSKSLEGVDRRSCKSKICTRNAFGQRACLSSLGFFGISQKFLVFALPTHKKLLPSCITEDDCVDRRLFDLPLPKKLGVQIFGTRKSKICAACKSSCKSNWHRRCNCTCKPCPNSKATRTPSGKDTKSSFACFNLVTSGMQSFALPSLQPRWPYKSWICMAGQSKALYIDNLHPPETKRKTSTKLCTCFCFVSGRIDHGSTMMQEDLHAVRGKASHIFDLHRNIAIRFVRHDQGKRNKICMKSSLLRTDRSVRSNDASAFKRFNQPNADASQRVKSIYHCEALMDHNHNEAMRHDSFLGEKKSVLELVQQIKDTICKKQLIECSTSVIVSISGGQDSIFLVFCLSFLQSKLDFTFKMLWCNHFWQTDSFYTTLHLTMCAVNFRRILITFLPLFIFDGDLLVFCNTPSSRTVTPSCVALSLANRRFASALPCPGLCKSPWHHRCNCTGKANYLWCMGHHRLASKFAIKDNEDISKRSPKMFDKTATSETIARHWRHLTTERSCTFYTLDKAIYGHTLSDRVETIMFNLIRGAGNTGIQSLLWKRKFSTFFYNWFFLSFQHVFHNTHFSTSVVQYPCPCKSKMIAMY